MASPQIAAYQPGDQPGLASLVNDVHTEFGFDYDPRLDSDLDNPDDHYHHVWVLEIEDRVIGSAALTAPLDRVTTLKRMYLRPEFRGQGWGRRLLALAIGAAIRDGCRRIELDTSQLQADACRVYERAGFKLLREVGRTRYYAMDLDSANV